MAISVAPSIFTSVSATSWACFRVRYTLEWQTYHSLLGLLLEKYFSWKLFLLYFRRLESESLEVFTEIRGCCGIVSGLVISPGFRYYRIRQPHSLLHPPTFLTTATSTSTIISTSTSTKISTSTSTLYGIWKPPSTFCMGVVPFFLQGFSSFLGCSFWQQPQFLEVLCCC